MDKADGTREKQKQARVYTDLKQQQQRAKYSNLK